MKMGYEDSRKMELAQCHVAGFEFGSVEPPGYATDSY